VVLLSVGSLAAELAVGRCDTSSGIYTSSTAFTMHTTTTQQQRCSSTALSHSAIVHHYTATTDNALLHDSQLSQQERRERQRERGEAEKRRADVMQLQEDRHRQAELKKAQMAREAQLEEQEYESAVRYNAEMTARERHERETKHAASLRHRDAILQQVQDLEAQRRSSRAAKFEEGRCLKQAAALEKAKLEAMRDKMVRDMEEKGFNPKYLSEMKAVDIHKMHMR
jgi:Trichohyalin-plectin-homology domain